MWAVPLEIFDHMGRAILVSDEHGTVRCCNLQEAALLDCDPVRGLGEQGDWPGAVSMSDRRCDMELCSLSPREKDVLRLLASGMSLQAIADTLRIEAVTVRNHVQGILRKLHVHRRIDAVLAWLSSAPPLPPERR